MKPFLKERLDQLTERANITPALFKHGLAISMKPRTDLNTVRKGSITFNGGEFFEHQFAPDEFADLLTEDWFTSNDLLSLQTMIDVDTFVFAYAKGTVTITQQDSSLGLFLIVEDDTNITLQSSGVGTARVHILVKKGDASFTHVQSGEQLVHKCAKTLGGSVKWADVIVTDSYVRSYVTNSLEGENTVGKIKSFYITSQNAICDIFTANYHLGRRTESDIVTRGVMSDASKALSRGLVSIGKNAALSQGYEQQDALILSNDAEADAIPNLEIHNHDVKCSHGSTVGRVDQEKLFYLMSRGLTEKAAKGLIVKGYFLPVLQTLDESVKTAVLDQLSAALE